jgi:hypothetical protein
LGHRYACATDVRETVAQALLALPAQRVRVLPTLVVDNVALVDDTRGRRA